MKTIKEYLYYFIKVNSEKSHRDYYRNYYAKYLDMYTSCEEKKSANIIKNEIRILKKYWNTYPIQYFRYNLYRKDCTLNIEEMKDYIPDYFAYYLLYPKSFKDRNILCEDKKLMYIVNTGLNIPQPNTLFFTENNSKLSTSLDLIDTTDCYNLIKKSNANKIFVKPTFGVGGKGIKVFNKKDNIFWDRNDNIVLDENYISEIAKNSYIIQEGVNQHTDINKIYPYAINTFRIITEYNQGEEPKIIFSLLRMGCGGMQIDNASSGGIYIKINSESGLLGKEAIADNRKTYTEHPDTQFLFNNYKIPFWNEIIKFAKDIASKYSPIKYIGWDIAYSESGPILIEGNNGPSIEIIQDHFGGVRKKFDINNPNDFWFSKNYGLKDL